MNDLVWILGRLTKLDGTILIPGLDKLVAPLTEEERQLYNNIDFDLVINFIYLIFIIIIIFRKVFVRILE